MSDLAARLNRAGHTVVLRDKGADEAEADVRHVFGWPDSVAADTFDGPVIASLGGPEFDVPATMLTQWRTCDRVVAGSTSTAERLVRAGVRRERLVVLPGAVDTTVFRPDPEGPPLRPGRRTHRLLCVAEELDVAYVVDALIALRRLPEARLFVAGGPPLAQIRSAPQVREIIDVAHRLGVGDRIFLLGALPADRAAKAYRTADVVLCVGGPDSAQAALKAMACATPVVAYAEGGLVDIIAPGVSGVLVEPGSPAALVTGIRSLITTEARRYAIAVGGLSSVVDRFAWPRVLQQLTDLYRAAIADRRPEPQPT